MRDSAGFRPGRLRALLLTAAAAGATRGAMTALRKMPPGGSDAWDRTNHRGATVSLLSGPAAVVGASAVAAVGAPGAALAGSTVACGLVSGAVGRYDDTTGAKVESASDKGFRGHVSALLAGRASGGVIKAAGIGAVGMIASGAVARGPVDRVVAGGIIAGTANLVNLLDLRPGRALKATVLIGAPLLRGPYAALAAAPVGSALALLPGDLHEETMLGDTGANGLGALLGLRLAAGASGRSRWAVLGALLALNAASEKVSFSRVIAATPGLRELDGWGRLPRP